jgi:hypothetical protein
MPKILYTVRAICPDVKVRGRYLSWLVPDHLLAVQAGGASSARVVLPGVSKDIAQAVNLAEGPAVVETQYVFPSRTAFEAYLRDHAPALRADGLKYFPPESGITYERQVAEIAAELD